MDEKPLDFPKNTFIRISHLNNLEVLQSRRSTRRYTRHFHQTYAFGVIDEGALGFDYRGSSQVAPSGSISLVIPGEVHTGYPLDASGWSYRMLYLQPACLSDVLESQGGRPGEQPYFPIGVINDPALAGRLRRFHGLLAENASPLLELECELQSFLQDMVSCYALNRRSPRVIKNEPLAVRTVKEYLDEFPAANPTIDDLCRLTHLTRYHLVRSFTRQVGLPPFAYQRQVRLLRARDWLRLGKSISETAALTGFADQSHLTRWFKLTWGLTPGEYSNSFQYIPLGS